MGTAYIPVIIEAAEGSVSLFDVECIAEVEYTTSRSDLEDWHVSDLKFQKTEPHWTPDNRLIHRTVAEAWCPDDLRAALIKRIDQSALEDKLVEHLYAAGEMSYANDGLRADYRSAVM